MLLTLALVVFSAAIMILFSQEFIAIFKKIMAIKGAKLLLPLFFGSWLALEFDYWFLWGIYYYKEMLHEVVTFCSHLFSISSYSYSVFSIIFLSLFSVIPVVLLDWYHMKKTFKHYEYPYLTSALIWICTAIVFVVVP
ncbi:hypothetical protein [Legionella worsleiensis]|uniref:Uncharacterized protein n=1 Tax=Legionella worsleiensis TaxID=45076 RepID=A0A0W1AJ39_9GAMM|nr:hypothetical protein [Legionella worsleiensis]KTD81318.1 hypothetical protein Lwor_0819 [Legionella worsleiensis]STY30767.1 Uncharacterised protein [Legionella worsleiensis]